MVTRVQEEIPFCTVGTLSIKQKKASFWSEPQFRSENVSATIEADQNLLAPQRLPNKFCHIQEQHHKYIQAAKVTHNNNANFWLQVWEVSTVTRPLPKKPKNSQH